MFVFAEGSLAVTSNVKNIALELILHLSLSPVLVTFWLQPGMLLDFSESQVSSVAGQVCARYFL